MNKKMFDLSSSTLHILAMLLMLCDHLCMTVLGQYMVLHYIGRIAFPIFAFMIVEGFYHTHDMKKYLLRMLAFVLLSEIPFDLMCGGVWFFGTQQNVLWTYMIAIFMILLAEQPKKIKRPVLKYIVFAITALFAVLLGFLLGTLTMVDYFGGGVVMVLVFYFFRGDRILSFEVAYSKLWMSTAVRWANRVLQAVLVWQVCCEMLGGLCVNIDLFGKTYEVVVESFGILAMIPIWLYGGRKGIASKAFKYVCYAFYPVHIAILVILQRLI